MRIRRALYTQADRQRVQTDIVNDVLNDPDKYLSRYASDERTHDGHIISADLMKEMFSQYAESAYSRARYGDPVHNAAQALADEQLSRILSEASPISDQALFFTGVSGAGKSVSIDTLFAHTNVDSTVHFVYEGQLANANAAVARMQSTIDAGITPTIVAFNIEPESALQNTMDRYLEEGRGATIHSMATVQSALPESLQHVHDVFGDRVNLVVVDKSQGMNHAEIHHGWDNLSRMEMGNYEQIRDRLEGALENFRELGYATDAIEQAYGRYSSGNDHEYDRGDDGAYKQSSHSQDEPGEEVSIEKGRDENESIKVELGQDRALNNAQTQEQDPGDAYSISL